MNMSLPEKQSLADMMNLKERQKAAFSRLTTWLEHQDSLAECLLQGKDVVIPDPGREMHELVQRLLHESPGPAIHERLLLLSRLVQFRNKQKKASKPGLPLPEISVRAPRPKNPFRADRWRSIANAELWRKSFCEELLREDRSPADLAVGRLLASAALFGGLLSRKSLERFFAFLPDCMEHCRLDHKRLSISWTDKAGNTQRWFPDVLTSLLVLKLASSRLCDPDLRKKFARFISSTTMERELKRYFRLTLKDRDSRPRSAPQFLDAVLLDLELRVPRAIAQYAAGETMFTSVSDAVWDRLMQVKRDPLDSQTSSQDEESTADDREPESIERESEECTADNDDKDGADSSEDDEEPDWLKKLRDAMDVKGRSGEIGRALKKVNALLPKDIQDPAGVVFVEFVKGQLEKRLQSRKGITLHTVKTRTLALATRLPNILELKDLSGIDGDDLMTAYGEILDDAISSNQRSKLTGYLRVFHRFIAAKIPPNTISGEDPLKAVEEELTIKANLVTHDEFHLALDYLRDQERKAKVQGTESENFFRAAGLILILGFRAGLRRLEALKLQLDDLHETYPAELLIRPWKERRLKTPNATRKIPLYALLPEEELNLLVEWKRQRLGEIQTADRPSSAYLFAVPSLECRSLPERQTFDLISKALNHGAGIGDASRGSGLTFHVTRHSCATWLTYALTRPRQIENPPWLGEWRRTWDWLETSSLRSRLYGNHGHGNCDNTCSTTRRHLYAVARLLGHSNPETSRIYQNLTDQLFALWLQPLVPELKVKHWAAASGRSTSAIYRWWPQNLTRVEDKSDAPAAQANSDPKAKSQASKPPFWRWELLQEIWRDCTRRFPSCLQQHASRSQNVDLGRIYRCRRPSAWICSSSVFQITGLSLDRWKSP